MSAATILFEAYGESFCLYATVLNVPKDATPSQLRKAYYKKCLQYHPDKLPTNLNKDETKLAKNKFQAISLAYTILSDEEKRKEYDESGDLIDDDEDLASSKSGMKQWTEYFDSIFPKVTAADIDAFEVKYKCSEEEEADVLKYYSQFKGDLGNMVECVMLSSDVDKERWVKDYIEPAIKTGAVDDFRAKMKKTLGSSPPKKRKTKGRVGKKKQAKEVVVEAGSSDSESETPEAEIVDSDDDMKEVERTDTKENKSNKKISAFSKTSPRKKSSSANATKSSKKKPASSSPDDDLIAQIRGNALARRQAGFDSMMAGLEDRYGGSKAKRKKKQKGGCSDIDDDEFARIQGKLIENKTSRQEI